MAKVALLIGVSEYAPGLQPLPAAVMDVQAIRKVLIHPEIGGFSEADVQQLINPDPQQMREAIEMLFANRQRDDLVLFYFSGHGIKDDSGKLHLTTRTTCKTAQGELRRATAVEATYVQEIMSNSRSKRQVVILDCCFSGAFAEGWLAKDDGSVDVKNQLGGEGRAVLTSSTSTQYSFEQQESELSIYTLYLVEGIETGAADLNNDGVISIEEVHEYAQRKVREAAPAMKPEIYAVREGYKIYLAQAPIGDPKLRYRKEAERFASRGEISVIGRNTLDVQRDNLGLLPEAAAAIEAEVLKPYQERKRKLTLYEQVLAEEIRKKYPLSDDTRDELKHFQQVLGLRNEDVAPIGARIASQMESTPSSDKTPTSIEAQTISHSKDVTSAKPPEEAVAASQAETPVPTTIRFPRSLFTSVPVIRKPRLLIGVGIATAVVLTFYFLTTSQPPNILVTAKNFNAQGDDKYYQGDYKGAIEDYTQALRLDPNFILAYYNRGYTRDELGDYKGAIEDYNKYIQLNPNDARAYNIRGDAYYELSNYQQAISDYSKAIEINPNYALAYLNRGLAYAGQGNYQQAISDYNKAIELKYDPLKFPYYNRGIAHYRLGQYKEAIENYNQAIRIDPNYANAYYNRGLARANLGDKQAAIADYQKAAELYQKQGKTKDYQETLDKIKKLRQ